MQLIILVACVVSPKLKMKYVNRAKLNPMIRSAIPCLPTVLIPIISNYQGYFLTLSEMTEVYHCLGMAHRNHRINRNIIFDPPETYQQFRSRLPQIMWDSPRYMCILFEFGSFEPCWVTIYYERKEQCDMNTYHFNIYIVGVRSNQKWEIASTF